MGVPGHDERDFEFARKYSLPIEVVVAPSSSNVPSSASLTEAYAGPGVLVNSDRFNGLEWKDANRRMTAEAASRGIGSATVQYRLKDWGISRQR